MQIHNKPEIKDLKLLEFDIFKDERGRFSRLFCQKEFEKAEMTDSIVQMNFSASKEKGTIRGLHYQIPPHAETKWVRVIKGQIFDVIIDLRKDSPTFLKWTSIELDESKGQMICIPKGCAHGFQTLTDNVEMIYFHSEFYNPDAEAGLNYKDPSLNINWPLPATVISNRDQTFNNLEKTFNGLEI